MRQYRATYSDGTVFGFLDYSWRDALKCALEYTSGTVLTLVSLERIFKEEE